MLHSAHYGINCSVCGVTALKPQQTTQHAWLASLSLALHGIPLTASLLKVTLCSRVLAAYAMYGIPLKQQHTFT